METIFAVAVDGPAGSGKSTVAKEIAKRLGLLYIDTGAMYRTVGYAAQKKGIALEDETAVTAMLSDLDMKICPQEDGQKIYLEGEDVTQKIRTQEAGKGASIVAAYAGVREELVQLQQKMAQAHSVIMDGRDIATGTSQNLSGRQCRRKSKASCGRIAGTRQAGGFGSGETRNFAA